MYVCVLIFAQERGFFVFGAEVINDIGFGRRLNARERGALERGGIWVRRVSREGMRAMAD